MRRRVLIAAVCILAALNVWAWFLAALILYPELWLRLF